MKIHSISNTFAQNNYKSNIAFKQILKNEAQDTIDNNDKLACIIIGPSGVGKGSILGAFKKEHPDFLTNTVSCTTRNPRPGEIDGISYNFITADEFKKGIDNDEFLEYNEVYSGRYYGTRTSDVEKAFNQAKKNVMLELDVDGAKRAKQQLEKAGYPVVSIFIRPDTIARLQRHLTHRGTETPDAIKERLGRAEYEIAQADNFDVIIQNNGEIQENVDDLNEIFDL